VSDALGAVTGWALIAGLFVWWWVDRRKRKVVKRGAPVTPTVLPPPAAPALQPSLAPPTMVPEGRHFSVGEFVVLPFIMAFLLFVVSAHLHDAWGTVWSVVFLLIAAALGGAALWDLIRGLRSSKPDDLPRWLTVAVLVGYGVLPLAGWYQVVVAHQRWGILLPLVPAVLFGVVVGVTGARGRITRR
jgi:hypothetical protein